MKFKKENVNPINRVNGDCVIRAISKATNRPWLVVFDNLVSLSRKMFVLPNGKEAYSEYLKEFETGTCNAVKGKKRKKVADFMKGTYVLATANHLTCVVDGVNIDLWDNRQRCVYRYWKVKE